MRNKQEPPVPSGSVAWFFQEAVRRIWVTKRTSFVAVAMIALSLLVVGAFLLVAENIERAAGEWQGRSTVIVYLDSSATEAQIAALDAHLREHRNLSRRRLVSREEALARFRGWFGHLSEVIGQLDENPFPPSFEIEVDPRYAQSSGLQQEIAALRTLPGVDQVQYDREWITRLRRLVTIINTTGLIAGGVLAIVAAFTIANVIRLTMVLYREEIEIMRLVGATERIIRGPFLVEGLLQGTLGALIAVAALYGLFELGRQSLTASSSIVWGTLLRGFLPWQKVAGLIAGGMVAGWFGSWLSVRE